MTQHHSTASPPKNYAELLHMNLTDTMLRMMLNALRARERVSSWREAAFGSFTAADPEQMIRFGERLGKKFFQTYGSSEVLALMTYPAIGTDRQCWTHGGGVPVSSEIKMQVKDPDTGQPAAIGVQGEIEVKGPNVTCGLLTAGEIVPTHFTADNFFPTGGLGYLLAPDDVVYVARLDDALRLAGFLVSPREVEVFLRGIDGVREAQFIVVEGHKGAVPIAFIIPETENPAVESKMLELCHDQQAAFKQPKRVFIFEEFPMVEAPNGYKVQRNKLRETARKLLHEQNGSKA